jgi:hypothetical protein
MTDRIAVATLSALCLLCLAAGALLTWATP